MKKSLPVSEWTYIYSILIVMVAFIIVAKINARRAFSEIVKIKPVKEVLITIAGEVSKPGKYKVLTGTTLKSALKKAKPKKFSNLKDLPLKTIIEAPLTIDVKKLSELHVEVIGEVEEPTTLKLKPGTRISDLKSKLILTEDADKKFFRSRKQVLDGDLIRVPKKTVEQNAQD